MQPETSEIYSIFLSTGSRTRRKAIYNGGGTSQAGLYIRFGSKVNSNFNKLKDPEVMF